MCFLSDSGLSFSNFKGKLSLYVSIFEIVLGFVVLERVYNSKKASFIFGRAEIALKHARNVQLLYYQTAVERSWGT
jgi:hypothetical protein